jgi:AraC family transcriptional regulator
MIGVPAKRWATRADLYKQLDKAKQLLDTCSLDGVTVSECAREAGLSLHHFLRLFHETHGMTPHQYLTERRIRAAQELLVGSETSVSEIAVEVGFRSASALGRAFKGQTGVSPSNYRKRFSQDR